jgi:hypothetical protein
MALLLITAGGAGRVVMKTYREGHYANISFPHITATETLHIRKKGGRNGESYGQNEFGFIVLPWNHTATSR